MSISDEGLSISEVKSVKSIKRSTHVPAPGEEMPKELDVMAIAFKFFLDEVDQLTDTERKIRISELDALELYNAVQMVHRELANFKLENHIMVDFLEKNDPKLLVGLRNRRASMMKKAQIVATKQTPQGSLAHNSSRHSSKRSISMSVHMASSTGGGGTERRKALDYKLNFKAKAELAEKAAAEVERRVTDIERNGREKL